MIISHKYKFIFIRIPKTASTSVEQFCKTIDNDCIISDESKPPYGHYTSSQVKNMVSQQQWNEYFKFTFVREPNSWVISQYRHNLQYYYKWEKIQILLDKNKKLRSPEDNILTEKDVIKLYILLDCWFKYSNQVQYIDEKLDFIGKFENLQEDLNKILKILNINTEYKVEHLNKNNTQKLILNDDSKEIIKILFKKDFELYNNL